MWAGKLGSYSKNIYLLFELVENYNFIENYNLGNIGIEPEKLPDHYCNIGKKSNQQFFGKRFPSFPLDRVFTKSIQ
jgi:hypothetical protein